MQMHYLSTVLCDRDVTDILDLCSVVAMGGDGTANKVVDGLLTASQRYRDVEVKPGFTPVRSRLPVGIIPCGNTAYLLLQTQKF